MARKAKNSPWRLPDENSKYSSEYRKFGDIVIDSNPGPCINCGINVALDFVAQATKFPGKPKPLVRCKNCYLVKLMNTI